MGGSTGHTERPHRGPKEAIAKATKIESKDKHVIYVLVVTTGHLTGSYE